MCEERGKPCMCEERSFSQVGGGESYLKLLTLGKNKSLIILAYASRREMRNIVSSLHIETGCIFLSQEALLHPQLGKKNKKELEKVEKMRRMLNAI